MSIKADGKMGSDKEKGSIAIIMGIIIEAFGLEIRKKAKEFSEWKQETSITGNGGTAKSTAQGDTLSLMPIITRGSSWTEIVSAGAATLGQTVVFTRASGSGTR